ncbi:DsbA family oxidoreductase [Streptomyces sp. NPDC017979]|uniref:DsbA family oxidoreductase n=1 Tax=Streptomyces sp. NPDC017979 TaxID=3365024 RepID=UPI0037B980FD
MRVEIWGDVVCPWCYVGKARFEKGLAAFDHRDRVEVVYRSYELDADRPRGETSSVIDVLTKVYGCTREEAQAKEEHVAAGARGDGLPYLTEGRDHGNTFDVHRLLHLAKARGRQRELLDVVYRTNFAEQRSVFDHEVLAELAVEAGLDGAEARAVLADEQAYAADVRADEREAAELGARGVPFFVVDRRYGLSGGQPPELFAEVLEKAWQSRPAEGADTAQARG